MNKVFLYLIKQTSHIFWLISSASIIDKDKFYVGTSVFSQCLGLHVIQNNGKWGMSEYEKIIMEYQIIKFFIHFQNICWQTVVRKQMFFKL